MLQLLIILPIALIVITIIQLYYYLFIFKKLAFYKESEKTNSQEYPVSVIICAKDEAQNLSINLPGALCQDYRTTHEVIVVNDNSTDESKYLLEEFQKQFRHLNIVTLMQEAMHIPGKKFPLSMGIKAAKYETLLMTDADCVPASEHWIKHIQHAYKDGVEIVLGYGAYKKASGFLNKVIRFETFHTAMQYFSYALSGMPYMGVGRNLSYLREVFNRNKGFSAINHIPSGDDDLFINMVATSNNTAIAIHPEAFTVSTAPQSWSAWMKQKQRHYTTARYYKPKHKFLLGLYATLQTSFLPVLIATAFFYDWRIALSCFLLRAIVQYIIIGKAMQKLNEKDLIPLIFIFDVWMFFYNLLFVPALWKKPAKNWH